MSLMSLPRGVLIGAVATYYLDPVRGRARRARVRDAAHHARNHAATLLEAAVLDARHRLRGVSMRVRGPARGEGDEYVVEERVRSQLGHVVSYPGAISILVDAHRVTLRGPVLADEAEHALIRVRRVGGARTVIDELDRRSERDVPALQGPRPHERNPDRWRASSRGLALVGGGGLVMIGLGRGGMLGALQVAVGLALAGRASFNLPVKAVPRRAFDELRAIVRETPGGTVPGHHRADEKVTDAAVIT